MLIPTHSVKTPTAKEEAATPVDPAAEIEISAAARRVRETPARRGSLTGIK
jgi:hypothetical protein